MANMPPVVGKGQGVDEPQLSKKKKAKIAKELHERAYRRQVAREILNKELAWWQRLLSNCGQVPSLVLTWALTVGAAYLVSWLYSDHFVAQREREERKQSIAREIDFRIARSLVLLEGFGDGTDDDKQRDRLDVDTLLNGKAEDYVDPELSGRPLPSLLWELKSLKGIAGNEDVIDVELRGRSFYKDGLNETCIREHLTSLRRVIAED